MAIFEPPSSQPREEFLGFRRRHPRVVGHGRRKRLRRAGLREHRVGLRLRSSGRRCIRAASRPFSGWASVRAIACSRSASAPASTPRCIRATARSPASTSRARCSKRRATAMARKGIRNVRLLEMDAADLKFADGTFDIVYAPYVISVVPDPVAVVREMQPRLPPRRPHHHPESLPQPQSRCSPASSAPSRPSPFTSASSPIWICRRFSPRPISSPCRSRR